MISFKYHVCASDYFFFFSDQRTEMLLSQSSMHSLLPDESWARYPAWRAAICTNTVNNFTFWNNKHERQHLLTLLFSSKAAKHHTRCYHNENFPARIIFFFLCMPKSAGTTSIHVRIKSSLPANAQLKTAAALVYIASTPFSPLLSGSGSVRGLPPLKETSPGAAQTTSGRRRRRRRGHLRRSFQLSLALSYFFLSKRGSQRTRSRVSAPAVAGFWTE